MEHFVENPATSIPGVDVAHYESLSLEHITIYLARWRSPGDYKCGSGNLAPNGKPGICNPTSHAPCCSKHGWCGSDPAYKWVKSGLSCNRITSKEECENAASELGHSDTTADTISESSYPPYCSSYHGALKWNTLTSSSYECDSDDHCLCASAGKHCNSELQLYTLS